MKIIAIANLSTRGISTEGVLLHIDEYSVFEFNYLNYTTIHSRSMKVTETLREYRYTILYSTFVLLINHTTMQLYSSNSRHIEFTTVNKET